MITQTEYKTRRQRLMSACSPNSIILIPSAQEQLRNGFDNVRDFRQNSDFLYLTGFNEPEAVAVLIPNEHDGEFILFNRPRDKEQEIWNGYRSGQEGACKDYGANQAFSFSSFEEKLPELLVGKTQIYYPVGRNMTFDRIILRAFNKVRDRVRRGIPAPTQFTNVESLLHEMRLIKSDAEIEYIRYVCETSAHAHLEAMKAAKPGINEYELEAIIRGYCGLKGCREMAYTPIVAGGNNACILHYVENRAPVEDGECVLIDAGGEYHGYAADITRTFPINGKFTAEQRAVYDVVLASQNAICAQIKPGTSWIDLQNTATNILTQGLIDLGLLKGSLDQLIETKAYKQFYMHLPSHWLGLDTHDAGTYTVDGEWRTIAPNMVMTVEPGLYIPKDTPNVPEGFLGIGVRIEDNVLATENGPDILTKAAPKEADEMLAVVGKA